MSEHDHRPDPEYSRPPVQVPTVWGAPSDASPTIPPDTRNTAPTDSVVDTAAPKPGKRVSTTVKTLTAVGVAAVIAVGGTIAITSANASTSAATTQGGPVGGMRGSGVAAGGSGASGRSGAGGFGEMAVIGSALHGEFVVADGTATITERIQTGSVSSVSSTGITVESSDDFAATYVVGSGVDVSAYPAGTEVTVIAKVSGSTVTATSVTAARSTASGAGGFGGGPAGGVGGAPNGPGAGSTAGSGTGVGTGSGAVGSGQPTI